MTSWLTRSSTITTIQVNHIGTQMQKNHFSKFNGTVTEPKMMKGHEQDTNHEVISFHVWRKRNSRFQIISTKSTPADQYKFHKIGCFLKDQAIHQLLSSLPIPVHCKQNFATKPHIDGGPPTSDRYRTLFARYVTQADDKAVQQTQHHPTKRYNISRRHELLY